MLDDLFYVPAYSEDSLYGYPSVRTLDIPQKHNVITSLNGCLVELSESPVSMKLQSNIPINYATNPIDTENLDQNVFFGGFIIIPMVPIRFGDSITSVVARPYLNFMDVEFTPWK